ncbi:hypothetical protein SDC9_101284 [bioreactor metagenome]|uniref:Uncharacterized protein n=1 Tax=bioreactor metagenome TaxID=1076179 RepID=A0A645ANL6_9ZZZZ
MVPGALKPCSPADSPVYGCQPLGPDAGDLGRLHAYGRSQLERPVPVLADRHLVAPDPDAVLGECPVPVRRGRVFACPLEKDQCSGQRAPAACLHRPAYRAVPAAQACQHNRSLRSACHYDAALLR